MKKILTIAGSDCSGGAGIQADLKTIAANGGYGMSVITAITAQNTVTVSKILNVPKDMVIAQLDSIFTDIYPDAVKIGMLSCSETIISIADIFKKYNPKNIVIDPVMISSSQKKLITDDALNTLQDILLPMADLITPNIFEAEVLSKMKINNKNHIESATKIIFQKTKTSILIKGGHLEEKDDFLYHKNQFTILKGENIDNKNTHGTGCTLSSAIACYLAKGYDIVQSCRYAKEYVKGAIADKLDLGKGNGPLNHMYEFF